MISHTDTLVRLVLAALQPTSKQSPEPLDKFVICQVLCYTEGEGSLRHTVDSFAALKYDDKSTLLFLICDVKVEYWSLGGKGVEKVWEEIVKTV
jgi:Chitin synthase